jgi:hypothetical protein
MNQSNEPIIPGGIAGEKWMLGFRTAGRIYYKFLFAKVAGGKTS